ncbi:hypothetical protein BJ165DRAFT_1401172 [Panaeolus papilionaceus]|nr:hypothetical protein BJ165DRAFT_1401172 [Panaeolus papilionaceus]
MSNIDLKNIIRESLENIEKDAASDPTYEIVGRVSPNTTFLGPVGFAPPKSDLASAEYLVTLSRPSSSDRDEEQRRNLDQQFDRHVSQIRIIQNQLSHGKDAEFLLVYEHGQQAVRLRRLVFDRRSPNSAESSSNHNDTSWPIPLEFRAQYDEISGLFTPRALSIFDKTGQPFSVSVADSHIKNRLVKAKYRIHHLALSRGEPGDEVDLFLGIIQRIDCLE